MHHTLPVRLVESVGNLDCVFESLVERQSAFVEALRKGFTVDQFHDQIVDAVLPADVVECADVRVIQTADGPGLTLETFAALRVVGHVFGKDFDGNRTVQSGVDGPIHFSHTARAKFLADFVRTESGACFKGHLQSPCLGIRRLD